MHETQVEKHQFIMQQFPEATLVVGPDGSPLYKLYPDGTSYQDQSAAYQLALRLTHQTAFYILMQRGIINSSLS